jgi:hypothetical protein
MLQRILMIAIIAVMSVFCLNGCKERSSGTQSDQEEVKTAAEYEADAKEQINKENMAEELERIDKELQQDISQEQ